MSHLRIGCGFYSTDAEQALAPVEVIDSGLHRVWAQPVPLGGGSAFVDVEPGSYLVRVHLPTGEIVEEQTTVSAGETKDVNLTPARPSPHEWLAWAYYRKPADWTEPLAQPAFLTERHLFQSVYAPPEPTLKFWTHRDGRWTEQLMNQPGVRVGPFPDPNYNDRRVLLGLIIEAEFGPRYELGQLWVQVRHRGISQFVALPPGGQIRVLVMDDETSARVIVDSGNPQAEMLLGYLISGDYGSARAVGEGVVQYAERIAETFLQEKKLDPARAAIGGYYLLRAGNLDRLHDWTRNLADWIGWMPDGAVIRAWHLLRKEQPSPDHALAWFLEAANRGIPLYGLGLRMLFDGLRLFDARLAEEGGPVAKAVDRLRPFLAAARVNSGTTCFFGDNPEDPQIPEDLGMPSALQPALALR